MNNVFVAIMAGGIGSRFWPLSRADHPKQFIDILGTGKTLIQATYDRFLKIIPKENIYVLTNEMYRELVKQQLAEMPDSQILGEPMRKNTAPTIAYFSNKISRINPEAITIVAPSDHLVINEDKFISVMEKSISFCEKAGALLTLGIKPSRPDTGYGYIQYVEEKQTFGAYMVKTFTEKPSLKIAKSFIKSGDFLWNSGMFIWKVSSILEAFKEHLHEVYEVFNDGGTYYNTDKESAFINKAFSVCPNISIDYGVMEKAENVHVIPADFGWSDLGTWASLYDNNEKDYLGNAVSGKNVMIHDATDCMVMAKDEKLVVLQGISDFIVVDTEDVLLIFHKSKEQDLKQLVTDLKRTKRTNYL